MSDVDIIVIGGGIAGASAAFALAEDHTILILEMEEHPGYHSTGRSAALYSKTYGNTIVRKLAGLSRPFLESPPEGFCDYPLLTDRGVLFLARSDQVDNLEKELLVLGSVDRIVEKVERNDLLKLLPVLQEGYAIAGIFDANAKDIDVDGLHKGYLKSMKKKGGALLTSAKVQEITPLEEGWLVKTDKDSFSCKILVNAAGAWADEIGKLAGATRLGLTPMKRTAFLFDPPRESQIENWPMVIDIEEKFYFKPDSGKLLGSPADQTASPPHDARADDLDIAIGVDRIEAAINFQIRHISHKWAGLRSFVQDRTPVVGFDPHLKNFFWLAGQGGYGIKTSPAMAACCASLIHEGCFPNLFKETGLSEAMLSPERL